jgi:alkylated DNA repair protein alkB family protein 6
MITEEIPGWLAAVVAKVNALGIFPESKQANHVLLNEYRPGQGILPHLDGDLFTPVICTVSLKSHTVLSFYETIDESAASCKTLEERLLFQLLLQPRSLLVLKGDLYEKYLHGIDEIHSDVVTDCVKNADICRTSIGQELSRDTRISLTIRNVPKTSKVKIKLFK